MILNYLTIMILPEVSVRMHLIVAVTANKHISGNPNHSISPENTVPKEET